MVAVTRASGAEKPLKVVLLEPRGAVPDYVEGLATALAAEGVAVVAVSAPASAGRSEPRASPLLSYRPSFDLEQNGGARNVVPYLTGWLRTLWLLVRERPDVLHVQWLVKPRVESRLLPLVARLAGTPLVVTVHNVLPHEARAADRSSFTRLYRAADRLVVHSSASARRVRELEPSIAPAHLAVVPHGNFATLAESFDVTPAQARSALRLPHEGVLVVAPGKVRPYKGTLELVSAFTALPVETRAALLVAGAPDDPVYARRVSELSEHRAGADIRLDLRYFSRADFHRLIAAADIVALPYREIDQSGILLYAMTCGKAIVASRLPAFEETLGADAALFAEPGSVEELTAALLRLIRDPELRARCSRSARERALREFSWPQAAQRTAALYRGALERPDSRPRAAANATALLEQQLRETIGWLRRAQDAHPDGGVSAGYTPIKGWAPSFPEVTGYIVPTFSRHAIEFEDPDAHGRAVRMAEWLLSLQAPAGWFGSGVVSSESRPSVFNTGQILFGLLDAVRSTGDRRYLEAAARAGDWLTTVQDADGSWPRHDYLGKAHVYNARTAWALTLLATALDETRYREAADRHLTWVLGRADGDAFFDLCAFDPVEPGGRIPLRTGASRLVRDRNLPSFYAKASLHTIAYTIQGVLETAWLLGRQDAERTATLAAATLAEHALGGRLAGYYGRGWQPAARSMCLTGAAQMAVVWLRLQQRAPDAMLVPAADAALSIVRDAQSLAMGGSLRGAVPGSKPLWGLYLPFRYPSWAAKFTADALSLRLGRGSETHERFGPAWA